MSPVRILAFAAAGLVALAPQTQQPTFRSRVDLIQVNVVAVNAAGEHVYGLTEADFTLLDRGTPQKIAAFQEIGADRQKTAARAAARPPAQVRRDVASNQVNELDRLVVLVVDDLHIYQGRNDRARAIAREAVAKLAPGAFMAVLFTSGERSTEITDDASRLLAAVETLSGRKAWRRPHQATDAQTPAPLNPEGGLENLDIVNKNQSVKTNEFFDNMNQFKTLEDASRMLRLSPARRKAFVMVSEGLSLNPTGVFDEPLPDIVGYHARALQDMMRSMRRSNVATYVLDPRGAVTTQQLERELHPSPAGLLGTAGGTAKDDDSPFSWANPIRMAQDGLRTIAEESGGFAVTNDDNLSAGLTRIIEDLDHYYLLGFYPADPTGPQYRPLEVKSSKPGLTLRFRRAYAEIGPPDPPKKGADPLAQLITQALPSSDVPMRLHAIQLPALRKDTRVAFALEMTVPSRGRQAADVRLLDDIRYGLFVVDIKNGKVIREFTNTAQVLFKTAGSAGQAPETVRYQILGAMSLPPGTYQVRASATSDTLAAGGSVFLPLVVADSSRRTLDVSDLALGFASGPQTAVARDKTLTAEDSLRVPMEPALDRVFAATDEVRLFASIARREALPVKATVSARTADGKAAIDQAVTLPEGDDAIDLVLPLARLAAGNYVLRVTVTGALGRVERELGFAIK